ncbi:MAG: hypothetical protein GTO18_15660 [Anaerolineales bacterium]|nr:hypothetical protein [Anaerolineales bacterium]
MERYGKESAEQFVSRIRRNHALEHATIHVLSASNPRTTIVGRSDSKGFFLYTNLPQDVIEEGVQLALARLRAGERGLAVHPNCGTNLVTSGFLSGTAAFLSMQGIGNEKRSNPLDRLPMAILAALIGLLIAKPIGRSIQQHVTTDADPGSLEILSIRPMLNRRRKLYRILTQD